MDDIRSILSQVAEGRLDPAAAAVLLDEAAPAAVDEPQPGASADRPARRELPDQAEAVGASRPVDVAVDRVVLAVVARPVRLVADPTVATVTVEGPHTMFREGGTVRIEGPTTRPGGYQVDNRGTFARWLSQASTMGSPMLVRINPSLAVEADVMAGSLDVFGMRGPVAFSVSAGSVKAMDCTGPFTGSVQAGSAKIETRLEVGESTLRVSSGSLDVRLLPGSDVHVSARSDMGEIKIRKGDQHGGPGERSDEVTVGTGKAALRIDVNMGSAKVRVP